MISKVNKYPIILSLLFLAICSTKSYAACNDPISPSVDWSGCIKRDIITNINFNGAKFVGTTFIGTFGSMNNVLTNVDFSNAIFDSAVFMSSSDISQNVILTGAVARTHISFVNYRINRLAAGNLRIPKLSFNNSSFSNSIIGGKLDDFDSHDSKFNNTKLNLEFN